jgi:CheY-like chemotaxis protein
LATILLVEDHTIVRGTIERLLSRFGHQVIAFEDGTPAIQWLAADGRADLILSDVRMKTRGEAVARAARDWGYAGPIYLMTGDPRVIGPISHDLEGLGVQGLFIKPFRWRDLLTQIEAALSARRAYALPTPEAVGLRPGSA